MNEQTHTYRVYFLVGAVRSGTTLLRLMLDHHPRICCFGEIEYTVDRLMHHEGDGWPPVEDYHRWLGIERRFAAHGCQIDPALDYPQLVRSFLDQAHQRYNKPLVGGTVHWGFEHLPRIWPEAKYIHLVRDGRDVARSAMQMGWAGNPWGGVKIWRRAEQAWDRLAATLDDEQKLDVTNEALVADPQQELTRICAFLGESYDPAMLTYPNDSTYGPPDASLCYQWKRKLTPRQLRVVEAELGPLMQARGYAHSGQPAITIDPLRRIMLQIFDKWGRMRFRQQRYGYSLWLEDFVLARLGSRDQRERVQRKVNEMDKQHLK